MRRIWKRIPVLAVALVAAACGDSGSSSREATVASVAEVPASAVGTNSFGVSVVKPEGWYEMSDTEKGAVQDLGKEMIAGDDPALRRAIDAAKPTSHNLFAFFRHAPGSPVDFNPSVMAVTESLALAPGVKTGSDYFFHMRRMLEKSGLNFSVTQEPAPYTIDGQSFDQAKTRVEMMEKQINQTVYMTRHDDNMVMFIQQWVTDEDLQATQAIVDSIKLDW